ncbi:MAG: sensor domain-containing protein [Gammaproteobacteria bacterium]|nr:sensor domain-containing protein [Gammaproteobacteria bacterium]
MNTSAPRSIDAYLEQLRQALHGQDAAVIQDALYDAEEYLRAEVAGQADRPEAEVLEAIASSYGAPDEVAEAYIDTEIKVQAALATPTLRKPKTPAGRMFGIFMDPRAYSSLFYLVFSMATGIFYFTFAVTGLSLSAGLMILIIGIPFFLLFLATSRVLSLVEGRIIESFLGVRMPRRPTYDTSEGGIIERIKLMLKDARTWTTLLYMLLMLPLGIFYFCYAIVGIAVSLAFIAAPIVYLLDYKGLINVDVSIGNLPGLFLLGPGWATLIYTALGIGMLILVMHGARGLGTMQGRIAKTLLVESGND